MGLNKILSLGFANQSAEPHYKKHGRIQRGQGVQTPPPTEESKTYRALSNTGPEPMKNHKATKPAFNVGPSSARQWNAIEMAFRWRADDDPFIAVFWSYIPSSTKKTCYQILAPSDKATKPS